MQDQSSWHGGSCLKENNATQIATKACLLEALFTDLAFKSLTVNQKKSHYSRLPCGVLYHLFQLCESFKCVRKPVIYTTTNTRLNIEKTTTFDWEVTKKQYEIQQYAKYSKLLSDMYIPTKMM